MAAPQEGFRFEVAFSCARPHRQKVRAIAELVSAQLDPGLQHRSQGKVFFDEWFEHEILGDDMDVLLQRIYHEQSLMVVADQSDQDAGRPWCEAEARAIYVLRFELDPARDETGRLRLLDARFGHGNVPGLLKKSPYLDGITKSPEDCAKLILKRHTRLLERSAQMAKLSFARLAPPSPEFADTALLASPSPSARPPILFYHPATNDAFYSRRECELEWLDGYAKDPSIRLATVTGVGGLGKTSLVGHWLEVRQGWQHRPFRGVFFYSFYSDRESESFFKAFLKFASACLNEKIQDRNIVLHHAAANLAQRSPFLVVLDGLEVLQADADGSRYGWINDGALNEFVSRLGEKGPSLLVLTSRFPFHDLTDQFPHCCRPIDLPMLSPREGADLLEKCGLPGDREACLAYSAQFGGHPLSLRLFAGACLAEPVTPPADLSQEIMRAERTSTLPDPAVAGLTEEESQRRRHRRQFQKLLDRLQAKLSAPKRRLLQLVAMFREPAPTGTLAALATGLDAMKADFRGCDAARIHSLLDALVEQHLLQREDAPGAETSRWSAHPIVREVFRAEAIKEGDLVAAQFATTPSIRSAESIGLAIGCARANPPPRACSPRRIGPSVNSMAGTEAWPNAISSSASSIWRPATSAPPPSGSAMLCGSFAKPGSDATSPTPCSPKPGCNEAWTNAMKPCVSPPAAASR
jgi:hypothetical protein